MAGWDGSGNFTVPYSFVNDAAANIKILASRQDTQWATVVAGLMNVQTRDGQNKPSANWDFNGKKITNAANATNPQDYATLAQLNALTTGVWTQESNPFTFVSATQFKVTGIDVTSRYTKGTRLKIIHNTGATTSYYTITASSFAVDTTVTVSGPNLVSTITVVYYSILDAANLAVPTPSAVNLISANVASLASVTGYTIGAGSPWATTTVLGDIYGELSAGVFTATYAGLYLVSCCLTVNKNGATFTGADGFISVIGTATTFATGALTSGTTGGAPSFQANVIGIVSLPAAGQTRINFTSPAFTGGPMQAINADVTFLRIR